MSAFVDCFSILSLRFVTGLMNEYSVLLIFHISERLVHYVQISLWPGALMLFVWYLQE
jgi:hypothetical protein